MKLTEMGGAISSEIARILRFSQDFGWELWVLHSVRVENHYSVFTDRMSTSVLVIRCFRTPYIHMSDAL